MDILNIQSSTSLVRATSPHVMTKILYDNHRVVLKSEIGSQTASAAYSQIVTIQYDKDAVAKIIKNSDV